MTRASYIVPMHMQARTQLIRRVNSKRLGGENVNGKRKQGIKKTNKNTNETASTSCLLGLFVWLLLFSYQELLTLRTLGLITFNFLSTLNLSLKPLNPTHSPTKIAHKDTNFFAYKAQYHPQFWCYLQHVTQGEFFYLFFI